MIDSLTHGFILPLYFFFSNTATPVTFNHANKKYGEFITINTLAEYNSNSIHTNFLWTSLKGGYLDQTMKDAVSNRLQDKNKAGFDFNTEIIYLKLGDTLFNKPGWGYYGGIKNRMIASARFKPAVFQLPFYGNAPFLDKEMDLSDVKGSLMMYQTIGFGFVKQWKRPKTNHAITFGAGFINGNFSTDFSGNRNTFYTSPDGQQVDVTAQFQINQSNARNFSPFFPNGQGGALEFSYEYQGPSGHNLTFQVNDFGFVSWNEFSKHLRIDTTVSFNGVTVADVFAINEGAINGIGDSLSSMFQVAQDSGRYLQWLPVSFHAGYTKIFSESFPIYLQLGVQYVMSPGYIPRLYLRSSFYPVKWFMVGAGISYGGFGSINYHLDLGFHFGRGYQINLQTRNLEGMVPNNYGTGVSAGFRFTKNF